MNGPSPEKAKNAAIAAGKYIGTKIADNLAGAVVSAVSIAAVAALTAVYQEELKELISRSLGEIVASAVGFSLGCALILLLRRYLSRKPVLDQWGDLTSVTGLAKFEERNQNSSYMPGQIIGRPSITSLSVMANGCSKWTRMVPAAEARNKFKKMVEQYREIRFLASCPIHLNQIGDPAKTTKSIRNAKSLIALKSLRDDAGVSSGSFEIRTYKHVATIRLIIIDGKECVVGHYKEGGDGDSLLTPLLIFECDDEKEWGFGHAFVRLFNSEWARSSEPTTAEWKEIALLASKGVLS